MKSVIKTALALSLVAGGCTQQETPESIGGSSGAGGSAQSGGGAGITGILGGGGAGVSGSGTSGSAGSGVAATGGGAGVGTGGSAGTLSPTAGTPATGGMAGTLVTAGAGGDAVGGSGGTPSGGAGGGAPVGGFAMCPFMPEVDTSAANFTAGTVIRFNDDGAWTWYCDERAIVDVAGGKIIVGSDANGGSRNGAVEAVIYDVATKTLGQVKQLGKLAPDDHNVAAFLVKPDGKYLAAWAGHNENCNTYWSNHDGSDWAPQKSYPWMECPFRDNRQVTYNNLWNMTAESKIYNFVRAIGTSPNVLTSSDNGATWQYGGRLSATPPTGYVAGYYKYWGNQVDRVDFFATEAHPRDYDNSLYHGYVKGGKTYSSTDEEIDADLADGMQPEITRFTRVFATQTTVDGDKFNHMWNSDVMRYDDGTVAAIGMGRTTVDGNNPDHSFLYFRFKAGAWTATHIGKAGKKLYDSEQDYVGLGSLHPNDPRIIYISSPFDPRDDSALEHREIFQGVTCDEGATFSWTPITFNSSVDNLRPIVPAWDANNMVLLWFRGSYSTAQIYDEEVVGIVTQN